MMVIGTHGIRIATLLVLGLVLAGCGGSSASDTPVQPPAENGAPAAESNAGDSGAQSPLCPQTNTPVVMESRPDLQPLTAAPQVGLELVADGFDRPLYVTSAGDGSGRLFVVEKGGRVQIVRQGERAAQPFLDIGHLVEAKASERGLLSIAFHPDYAENGFFVVNYTDVNGDTVIARYQVSADPEVADAGSGTVLLAFAQPAANHNGGGLAFGPDGYLYIGTGDGGRAGDPWNNAQSCDTLLGKMLRIEVSTEQDVTAGEGYRIPPDNPLGDQPGRHPEIWAWGMRNPWRYSFDRETGDLYIGDVGQNEYEEIHYLPATETGMPPAAARNYGWNIMEGAVCYSPPQGCNQEGLEYPVLAYAHSEGCSITGGFVYRGNAFPAFDGLYFYGDYCSGTVWVLRQNGAGWQHARVLETGMSISSFGEDEAGELYLTDIGGGGVYRLVEQAGP